MENKDFAKAFHASRRRLTPVPPEAAHKDAEEGGCGVTGFACSVPVGGKHIFEPSRLMHNRGNGKGGGIAAAGLVPEDLGVTREVLDTCYLLQVALLDPDCREALEQEAILPYFDVVQSSLVPTLDDYREVEGLEIRPPDVVRYFLRAKEEELAKFKEENDLAGFDEDQVESEFIWQKNILLNRRFYDTAGEKSAFVMSQGRNIIIFKIVGYAEQVAQYYKLDDVRAHVWIAHQRYPTKGRVWHPAGAHPFMGMDVALVHNGDFANYFSVAEYLRQKNIYPHFHTDTEVAVLMFDLLNRVYGYPLEYIVEALAPTTEMDFDRLPEDRQAVYGKLHHTHIHGSPDGPWFFIIAKNDVKKNEQQLIGITDTAMLRPQVFAFHDGEIQVALVCSEKQAIDATLASLHDEDPRVGTVADRYWNARGGSYTDGGTFAFTVKDDPENPGRKRLSIADKFGAPVTIEQKQECNLAVAAAKPADADELAKALDGFLSAGDPAGAYSFLAGIIATRDFDALRFLMDSAVAAAVRGDTQRKAAIKALTDLNDYRYPTGALRRRSVLQILRAALKEIFAQVPPIGTDAVSSFRLISLATREKLAAPKANQEILVVNAAGFEPEGDDCDARLVVDAYNLGWRKFICYGYRGQRFLGCGFGPATEDVEIDVYGSSGDYLASGIDGMTIRVHGNAQDQLGQIAKSGKLVIYGDVGQTFMYGAKGGEVFVMGNAAGRPLINGVGKPRVVINGTALDYLAESFMAGDHLKGGGFVILNGVSFDTDGKVTPLAEPYPGSNLFSLASGGAIFVRDPHGKLIEEQLNEGAFLPLTKADWRLILPYLTENEKLFGISVEDDLLTVDGEYREPAKVYRKIVSKKAAQLAKETVNE